MLKGGAGDDKLKGNAGADQLFGHDGAEVLLGGGDADRFYFDTALGAGNVDEIFGFTTGTDSIFLDDAVFAGLAPGASCRRPRSRPERPPRTPTTGSSTIQRPARSCSTPTAMAAARPCSSRRSVRG